MTEKIIDEKCVDVLESIINQYIEADDEISEIVKSIVVKDILNSMEE